MFRILVLAVLLSATPGLTSAQVNVGRPGRGPIEEKMYPRGIQQRHITRAQVTNYLDERLTEFDLIEPERRDALLELARYVHEKRAKGEVVKLTFICTGNSRRSQLGQIWSATAAAYFGIDNVFTYSGGTIITAFNRRIARSLMRAGFVAETIVGNNADYKVHYSEERPPLVCFSKRYDDPANPTSGFAAVMVCADADEHCPVVPGAEYRIAIPYEDPRLSDHSDWEEETYDERNAQIAREMLFVMAKAR